MTSRAVTYEPSRANSELLIAIVHQALDVELDAPKLDTATHRACEAFALALMHSPESWPELNALRDVCRRTIDITPERLQPMPPLRYVEADPRLAIWDRAYLAALEQMIRVTSPSEDTGLQRCSAVAEVMAVIAVRTRAKVSAPGALDELQAAVDEMLKTAAQNDRQARTG